MYFLTFPNIAAMRMVHGGLTIPTAAAILGEYFPLDESYRIYHWDELSTDADSFPDVVHPTDPDTGLPDTRTGRWKHVDMEVMPQVNADWSAPTGPAHILNKPSFATVATTGVYSDLTGKPVLANVATSGSYVDLTNKPTIPTVLTPSQSAASRTLNTAFQVSSTRNAWVTYSVQLNVTASIAGGQNGDIILEMADDSGFTTGVQQIAISGLGQTYTLAVAIQGVQPQTGTVIGFIPAGKYVRLRTVNNTGTPTYSIRAGQEVLI